MTNIRTPAPVRVLAIAVLILVASKVPVLSQDGPVLPDHPDAGVTLGLSFPADDVEPAHVLRVFTGAAQTCCEGKSPLAGSYRAKGTSLVFKPAFGFLLGQTYTVWSQQRGETAAPELTEFTLASDMNPAPPRVLAVHPGGLVLPENTLRFYVHFSQPMKPHVAARHIKLLDATGREDPAAFMAFKQELWNEDRTRLTVLMDPGRIKRGVAQNRSVGPALLAGNRYSFVVEQGWPEALGSGTMPRFEKHFDVSPPLRQKPDTSLWRIKAPRAQTLDPLIVNFDRPFDHQLAQRAITVLGPDDRVVSGTAQLGDTGQSWRFTPDQVWSGDSLSISVDARLEDVAGNNFNELLDHSVGTNIGETEHVTLFVKLAAAPF